MFISRSNAVVAYSVVDPDFNLVVFDHACLLLLNTLSTSVNRSASTSEEWKVNELPRNATAADVTAVTRRHIAQMTQHCVLLLV